MPAAPWTVAIACLLSYLFLFNPSFERKARTSNFWRLVRNQGVVPAQLFAIILAPILLREIPMPQIQWGLTPLSFGFVMEHFTIFGIGFPEMSFFLAAIPSALTTYIIAFSDFVLAKEVVAEATAAVRTKSSSSTPAVPTSSASCVTASCPCSPPGSRCAARCGLPAC